MLTRWRSMPNVSQSEIGSSFLEPIRFRAFHTRLNEFIRLDLNRGRLYVRILFLHEDIYGIFESLELCILIEAGF